MVKTMKTKTPSKTKTSSRVKSSKATPKVAKPRIVKKIKAPASATVTGPRSGNYGIAQIESYQKEILAKLKNKRASKESAVNHSTGFLEATLKTLFSAGFEISKIDPVLGDYPLNALPYGRFYVRLAHKNFRKLKGDKYTPELFISFSSDHEKVIVAKYCLNFDEEGLTILVPANVKGNWLNRDEPSEVTDWYSLCQPKITSFLSKIVSLVKFVESTRERKISEGESERVKKEIVDMFMAPKRINDRHLLWSKTDKSAFLKKFIYKGESNLFEAMVNVIGLFTATKRENDKEYIEYAYAEEKTYNDKNAKLAKDDIKSGNLAVPVPLTRRTYYIFSSITEAVENFDNQSLMKSGKVGKFTV